MQDNRARAGTVSEQVSDYEDAREEERIKREAFILLSDTLDFRRLRGKEPPARQWMVEDTFLKGTVGLFTGAGKIGKSLVLQQLASCAALGRPWLGRKVAQGRVLFIACEDDHDELWRRQAAINHHLGVDWDDYYEGDVTPRMTLRLWPRVGQDNSLMYLDRPTWKMARAELFDLIIRRCRQDGYRYVIIDTATQTFRGNQNDETQVMDYITELRRLAVMIQGVVILTKHPSMSGLALGTGESGNTAWRNSVRAMFYMHRSKETKGLVIENMGSNYAAKGEAVPIRWKDGVFILDEPEQGYEERYYQR